MIPPGIVNLLQEACARHYLSLDDVQGDTAVLRYEKEAHPTPLGWLLRYLELTPDARRAPVVRAFVAGASAVIRVPMVRGLTFTSVAGGILPRVVHEGYLEGHRAASGRQAYSLQWAPGLQVAIAIEDAYGFAVLTTARAESWGVTQDRITSAARSNLYHLTASVAPSRVALPVAYEVISTGDSFDSGRTLLFNDLHWERADRGFAFAVPSQDALLMAAGTTDEEIATLAQAAESRWAEADSPVCSGVFLQRGRKIELCGTGATVGA